MRGGENCPAIIKRTMKGVKTAVQTDWKNYAHGNTRGPFRINKGEYCTITGLKKGDSVCISYRVEWKGLDRTGTMEQILFQLFGTYGYIGIGFDGQSTSGEKDVRVSFKLGNHYGTDDPVTENDVCGFYMHDSDWGVTVAPNGYVKISNFMVSKGEFRPYVDSDELKVMGGAINKARIVALVLSEERRAA